MAAGPRAIPDAVDKGMANGLTEWQTLQSTSAKTLVPVVVFPSDSVVSALCSCSWWPKCRVALAPVSCPQ